VYCFKYDFSDAYFDVGVNWETMLNVTGRIPHYGSIPVAFLETSVNVAGF
jgi:hypothetical protein